MSQRERICRTRNDWEAVPWDASDEVADAQWRGFCERSAQPIRWASIRAAAYHADQWFPDDVEFYAELDGEHLLLIRLAWHGFPDPPEWGLASRAGLDGPWSRWGYFANLPAGWRLPGVA